MEQHCLSQCCVLGCQSALSCSELFIVACFLIYHRADNQAARLREKGVHGFEVSFVHSRYQIVWQTGHKIGLGELG